MEQQDFLTDLHYLPIIIFIALPSVFILTYVIAVLLGHVEAGFPYISDSATEAPESCIFAQFINMLAMLMSFVIYIRYSQVKECTTIFSLQSSLPKWNHWALIFGLISAFGLSLVANFQETSVLIVHFIGAILCFGCGTAYFWTQAVCTFYLHPLGCSIRLVHLRTALSIFCTVCFFVTLTTGVLAGLAFKGTNARKWYKGDGGWELHVASTISEWLCAAAFCIYILTFTNEFRDIRISHPKVVCEPNPSRLNDETLTESQNTSRMNREQGSPRTP
ncbi:DNA damage-regulated autophagy modulator protein 1-like [Lasioglossum baleicum]|uniref:DNA damage-regulated autophagy modulator protein 1-like n=1 Tax=Lasioglossum baleicum TaxID=434251 RepID=UPI003FCE5B9B